MKKCSCCKQEKPFSEFHFRNRAEGLYKHQCIVCDTETRKRTYQKHKEKVIANVRAGSKDTRDWYQNIKSRLSCSVCGESDPACLDFHHLDPSEKESDPSQMMSHSKKMILEELAKCACLCSNCHRKEHVGRLNVPLVKVDINEISRS